MSSQVTSPSQISALPKGGGAQHRLGKQVSPALHTGTGTLTVPLALPPGRNGFQPQLNLAYSTGNGNGYLGLGWSLNIPGVMRKTASLVVVDLSGTNLNVYLEVGFEMGMRSSYCSAGARQQRAPL